MDPTAVAAYYRAKGYVVRDGARVPGPNGVEHKVPLLAEGPLGSLAVFFGDFGGVDGPEMGGARKVAREIGATPVLAADEFSNPDRQLAARLGVVLIDAATLAADGAPTVAGAPGIGLGVDTGRAWPGLAPIPARRAREAEPEPHPWPASGRVGGRDGPATKAVDVEEMLATPMASGGRAGAGETATASSPGVGEGTDDGDGEGKGDGEGLWKKPRAHPAPGRSDRASGPKFAWLYGKPAAAPTTPSGPSGLAVEYDDTVSARSAASDGGGDAQEAGGTAAAPETRLGDAIELQPTLAELEHRARRDRLLRRVFWLLFAIVVAYLVGLWWF